MTEARPYKVPPVALMIFNRPDTVRAVMRVLAAVRPDELFVVADGPRADVIGEAQRCSEARAVATSVTWPCTVRTCFSPSNLGGPTRFSTGLAWVFDQTDRAVILEDDCMPDISFFRFCSELLDRFANQPRVGMISGDNFQFGRQRTTDSYYFSRYTHIWGWATWARAWRHFDLTMAQWPAYRRSGLMSDWIPTSRERAFWIEKFDRVHDKSSIHWDYAWTFACWSQGMLTVLPARNLVSNVGFGAAATNTHDASSRFARLEAMRLEFPLAHPQSMNPNRQADAFTARTLYLEPTWLDRALRRLWRLTLSK